MVLIFERTIPRKVLIGIMIVVFLAAVHPLVLNNTRRLFSGKSMFSFSREENYFRKHAGEYSLLSQAAEIVRNSGCRDVGLKLGGDTWIIHGESC